MAETPIKRGLKSLFHGLSVKLGIKDPNMWQKSLETFPWGQFSMAVVRGNREMEDRSQVEVGENALFVGVYDGHRGDRASSFMVDHLFDRITAQAWDHNRLDMERITAAITYMENQFIDMVRNHKENEPSLSTVGTCALVGLLHEGRLHSVSVGDSKVLLISLENGEYIFQELTTQKNVNTNQSHREAYMTANPGRVLFQDGVHRVAGISKISQSLGDAFLKLEDCLVPEHMVQPDSLPYLHASPEFQTRVLNENHRFLVFGSHGFWELLENQQVVDFVTQSRKRKGIAKRLAKEAVNVAAGLARRSYKKFIRQTESRRPLQDDITVIVVFLDHIREDPDPHMREVSFKPHAPILSSHFTRLRHHMAYNARAQEQRTVFQELL
ncbi:hypothetical protein PIB30_093204 [Stylosanthes scabra]|uniref:PPM-type phosphatase domain-containing protein n=1 Tax=Stylosanthes scabra TaxID=79078 RepID=A0ABU6ZTR9_9FABA|nr:hypothetical protein [Stylosanthes scabra]